MESHHLIWNLRTTNSIDHLFVALYYLGVSSYLINLSMDNSQHCRSFPYQTQKGMTFTIIYITIIFFPKLISAILFQCFSPTPTIICGPPRKVCWYWIAPRSPVPGTPAWHLVWWSWSKGKPGNGVWVKQWQEKRGLWMILFGGWKVDLLLIWYVWHNTSIYSRTGYKSDFVYPWRSVGKGWRTRLCTCCIVLVLLLRFVK